MPIPGLWCVRQGVRPAEATVPAGLKSASGLISASTATMRHRAGSRLRFQLPKLRLDGPPARESTGVGSSTAARAPRA
jgi:hypothetical protein